MTAASGPLRTAEEGRGEEPTAMAAAAKDAVCKKKGKTSITYIFEKAFSVSLTTGTGSDA